MDITIKNYRGCESAELSIAPLALVAGINGAGKSSIAQAVAAALTGNAAVLPGVTKSAAGQLLRDGAKRGQCKIETAEGSATVNWPGASASTDGTPPTASPMACGLASLVDMKPKDAATTLIEILGALPTREDLVSALPNAPEAMVSAIWSKIESEGWDGAHKRAIARGQEYKGGWEHVTGERYGSAKANDWRPANYVEGVDADRIAELRAELEQAVATNAGAEVVSRQRTDLQAIIDRAPNDVPDVAALESQLEQAIANRAGDAGRRERLERDVATAEGVDLNTLMLRTETAGHTVATVQTEIDALPAPVSHDIPVACPHCGGGLEIVSRTDVRPAAEIDDAEQHQRAEAIREATGRLQAAQQEYNAAAAESNRAQAIVDRADQARAELSEFPAGTVTDAEIAALRSAVSAARDSARAVAAATEAHDKLQSLPDAEVIDVQSLRDELSEAEIAAHESDRVKQAAAYHQKILDNQLLIDELAPTGLRQRKLADCLTALNGRLFDVCTAAGWSPVEVGDDLSATLNGRPYILLSESEKFRVRVSLQVVLAGYDGSGVVIVDAADILDRAGRNGLIRMLARGGVPALVCMTIDEREKVPNLAKIGGRSYWMEGSVLTVTE